MSFSFDEENSSTITSSMSSRTLPPNVFDSVSSTIGTASTSLTLLLPFPFDTPTNSQLPSATSSIDTSSMDTVVEPPSSSAVDDRRETRIDNWKRLSGHLDATSIDWVLGGKLGQGAAGVVYKCMDRHSGDFFAAKKLNMADAGLDQMQKLAKEVTMLKDLKQPHIVSYRGYDVLDDDLYIFMDFCPGGDLQSVLKSFGGLSLNLTRRYTGQICTGLNYLHATNVLHRDVKAANVLLTVSGQAKLSDFGLAKLINEASVSNGMKTRSVVGSPYWMAPEVIVGQGSRPNGASDVWSLGATVYEMAASQPPLGHLEPMAALFHVGSAKELELGGGHNMLGAHGLEFVKACMNYKVEERPSCEALLSHPFLRIQDESQ